MADEDQGISWEAATGAMPSNAAPSPPDAYSPSFEKPERGVSFAQAHGVEPEETRGVLSPNISEGWFSGTAKGAGTGLIKGASHMPFTGMVGDVRNLAQLGTAYLGSKAINLLGDRPTSTAEVYSALEEARKPMKGPISSAPSGEELAAPVLKQTGEYKPKSEIGKVGMAFTEAATTGLSPSGKTGLVEKGLDIARRSGQIGAGGAAADVTARYTGSVPLALAVGALTPVAAGVLPTMARAHLAPEKTAKDLAGQVGREAARDEAGAIAALQAKEKLLPNVVPTMAQKSGDTGLGGLERRLASDKKLDVAGTAQQDIIDQIAASQKAVEVGGQKAGNLLHRDVAQAYNLTGSAPREMASTEARQIFSNLEEAADTANKLKWEKLRDLNVNMYRDKTVRTIDEHIAQLSPSERQVIPPSVKDAMEELRNNPSAQIPLDYIQKLRSQVLGEGRKQFNAGNNFEGGVNYELGRVIAHALGYDKNIAFGPMRAGENVIDLWKNAVSGTKNYHEVFNAGFLKKLNTDLESGVSKVPMDATFQAMLSDKNMARQNIEQLQKATNGAINPALSNYIVADFTTNGMKLIKPNEIDNLIGKNAAIVDMVPGLRDRLNSIKQAGISEQISAGVLKNSGDPSKLKEFFDKNRAEINQAMRKSLPKDRQYMKMLEDSAKRIDQIAPDKAISVPTLDKLAQGRTSDLLYGVATGRIAAGLVGAATAKLSALESMIGSPGYTIMAGGLAGLGGRSLPEFNNFMESLLSGKVRERAMEVLHEARGNPALMAELMKRPTPEKLSDILNLETARAATVTVQPDIMEYSRPKRASGGKVAHNIQPLVSRLMGLADQAKRSTDSSTKTLLDAPDASIVKALRVANQAI